MDIYTHILPVLSTCPPNDMKTIYKLLNSNFQVKSELSVSIFWSAISLVISMRCYYNMEKIHREILLQINK